MAGVNVKRVGTGTTDRLVSRDDRASYRRLAVRWAALPKLWRGDRP